MFLFDVFQLLNTLFLSSAAKWLTALLLNQASYSTGVTIEFKNEEECEAFHSAVQQWIKENNVQGAAL